MDDDKAVLQTEPGDLPQPVRSPGLDLPPLKAWRRVIPGWLRSMIWVDSAARYDAFLSYSWQADSATALAIHSVLQKFLCPWYKLRAKTIFRDLSCMPAGSSLKKELSDRLNRSTHLIVFASPEAARSRGMEMEARHWFRNKRPGEVLIIVTAGEFKTWDKIRDHLLPATVRDNLTSEPIWIPLQHRRQEILDNPKSPKLRGQMIEDLRQIFLRLYAPQTWEEMQGDERAQRRRALGMMTAAVLLFLGLAVAAISFGIGEQRNAREARARELAAYSTESLGEDPERSILLGMHAIGATLRYRRPSVPAAEQGLHNALLSSQVRLTLRGHSGSVTAVAFSPDGRRLATSSADKTAKLWDAVNGQELLTLRGHSGSVTAVAFSPDGRRLATSSADKTAKLWDAVNGQELLTLRGHSGSVNGIAFSPDGKRLATSSDDGTAKAWDLISGRRLLTLRSHSASVSDRTTKVSVLSDGSRLVPVRLPPQSITGVAFSPDGKRLATSSDGYAKLWDSVSGRELLTLSGHWSVTGVAFSSDGKRLATSSREGTAKVWDSASGKELLTLSVGPNYESYVNSVAFSPDGKRLATSSREGTAKVWHASSGQELMTLRGHSAAVTGVAFSPDGRRLATSSADGTAKVWDVTSGQELMTLRVYSGSDYPSSVFDVAFSPDGKRLATSTTNGTKVWDAVTGHELLTLGRSSSFFGNPIDGVAFSPDGKRFATGSVHRVVKVWDALSGQELMTLRHSDPGYPSPVFNVAFSPDGRRLATSSADKTAKVWDAVNGQELLTLRGHLRAVGHVVFSPDGKCLATSSADGTAKVWDAVSGQERMTVRDVHGVGGVVFSPDSKRFATSSLDGTAKVWDAVNGQELMTLHGHSGSVHGVAFSPDGKHLVTSGEDAIVQVFALDIRELLDLARNRVTRNLTPEECQRYLQSATCPPLP